jgi:hypothetical protein
MSGGMRPDDATGRGITQLAQTPCRKLGKLRSSPCLDLDAEGVADPDYFKTSKTSLDVERQKQYC